MLDHSWLICGHGGSEKPSSSSIAIGRARTQVGQVPCPFKVDGRVGFKFEIVDRVFCELGES
jgi:hypothetical protein